MEAKVGSVAMGQKRMMKQMEEMFTAINTKFDKFFGQSQETRVQPSEMEVEQPMNFHEQINLTRLVLLALNLPN